MHVENNENALLLNPQPDEPEVLIDVERQQTSPTSSAQEPHSANITTGAVLQSAPSQNLFGSSISHPAKSEISDCPNEDLKNCQTYGYPNGNERTPSDASASYCTMSFILKGEVRDVPPIKSQLQHVLKTKSQ